MSKPVSYLQTDKRWSSVSYSAPGESTTIGRSGCGPTAAAMVVASWKDKKETPVEACAWAVQKGYKAIQNGTYHSFFKPYGAAHGLTITQITSGSVQNMSAANAAAAHEKALEAIKRGDMVICLMGKGNWTSSGHYILWYDYDGTNVYINDPASTKAARLKNTLKLLQAQVKHYWICTRPSGGTKFNDYASGVSTPEPAAPSNPTTTASGTIDAAKSYDKSLAGTYKVTASAGLNIRAGSTTDKKETVQSGAKPASVPTGMKASSGYTGGAWDTDPAESTITGATTFTYTFTEKQAATVTKAPEAKSLTYTGSAQELVTTGEATMYGTRSWETIITMMSRRSVLP